MNSGQVLIWWALGLGSLAMMALAWAIGRLARPPSGAAGTSLMRAGLACAALYTALVIALMVHWILARK